MLESFAGKLEESIIGIRHLIGPTDAWDRQWLRSKPPTYTVAGPPTIFLSSFPLADQSELLSASSAPALKLDGDGAGKSLRDVSGTISPRWSLVFRRNTSSPLESTDGWGNQPVALPWIYLMIFRLITKTLNNLARVS